MVFESDSEKVTCLFPKWGKHSQNISRLYGAWDAPS